MLVDFADQALEFLSENSGLPAAIAVVFLLLGQMVLSAVRRRQARERLEQAEERIRMIENQLDRIVMQRIHQSPATISTPSQSRPVEPATPREKIRLA